MNRLTLKMMRLVIMLTVILLAAGPGQTATHLLPVANGHDLQNQVKTTAIKVIPAVVSIASTVMVRDQAFSDETLPFGLI